MKKLYMIAIALMVMLSATMSVVALTSKTINRQDGSSAYAEWGSPGGSEITFLVVTKTDLGTDVSLSICTLDGCKNGYKLMLENVFDMDKKLGSATLNPVEIELFKWVCDEYNCWMTTAGTATIQTQWTGTGDIKQGSYKWMSRYEDYMEKGSSSSKSREATATGSIVIDSVSQDLGTSSSGGLAKFESASMQMQK